MNPPAYARKPGSGAALSRFSGNLDQAKIVFLLWVVLFTIFSLTLPDFLSSGNLITLVRAVSVLGILAIGMTIVVIGRGVDLSIVAVMAISTALAFTLAAGGTPLGLALLAGLLFAMAGGLLTGFLVAYVEIPALFATLAMGALIYGFGRSEIVSQDVIPMPVAAEAIAWIGSGQVAGVPVSIMVFIAIALLLSAFLGYSRIGRFIYATGDNPLAARLLGLPVRQLVMLQYLLSASIGYVAGLVTATGVASVNTRMVNSTLLYDIILVVVLGGISLSGGKGRMYNVLIGTLLIGTLLNGLTIMDVQYTVQDLIKSVILLVAIIIDSIVNPRDEQTEKQGDI